MTPEEYNQELLRLVLQQYGTTASISKQDENGLFTSGIDYQVGDHWFFLLYPEISSNDDFALVSEYIVTGMNGTIRGGLYE